MWLICEGVWQQCWLSVLIVVRLLMCMLLQLLLQWLCSVFRLFVLISVLKFLVIIIGVLLDVVVMKVSRLVICLLWMWLLLLLECLLRWVVYMFIGWLLIVICRCVIVWQLVSGVSRWLLCVSIGCVVNSVLLQCLEVFGGLVEMNWQLYFSLCVSYCVWLCIFGFWIIFCSVIVFGCSVLSLCRIILWCVGQFLWLWCRLNVIIVMFDDGVCVGFVVVVVLVSVSNVSRYIVR